MPSNASIVERPEGRTTMTTPTITQKSETAWARSASSTLIAETQMPEFLREIADEEMAIYKHGRSITARNSIPDTSEIPITNRSHWLKIPDVICVFVDMKGSTQ